MQVEEIEVVNLRFGYPGGRGFTYAGGVCTGRLAALVRVHTDTPHTGTGAAYIHPGLVRSLIEGHLKPLLLNRDSRAARRRWGFRNRQIRG